MTTQEGARRTAAGRCEIGAVYDVGSRRYLVCAPRPQPSLMHYVVVRLFDGLVTTRAEDDLLAGRQLTSGARLPRPSDEYKVVTAVGSFTGAAGQTIAINAATITWGAYDPTVEYVMQHGATATCPLPDFVDSVRNGDVVLSRAAAGSDDDAADVPKPAAQEPAAPAAPSATTPAEGSAPPADEARAAFLNSLIEAAKRDALSGMIQYTGPVPRDELSPSDRQLYLDVFEAARTEELWTRPVAPSSVTRVRAPTPRAPDVLVPAVSPSRSVPRDPGAVGPGWGPGKLWARVGVRMGEELRTRRRVPGRAPDGSDRSLDADVVVTVVDIGNGVTLRDGEGSEVVVDYKDLGALAADGERPVRTAPGATPMAAPGGGEDDGAPGGVGVGKYVTLAPVGPFAVGTELDVSGRAADGNVWVSAPAADSGSAVRLALPESVLAGELAAGHLRRASHFDLDKESDDIATRAVESYEELMVLEERQGAWEADDVIESEEDYIEEAIAHVVLNNDYDDNVDWIVAQGGTVSPGASVKEVEAQAKKRLRARIHQTIRARAPQAASAPTTWPCGHGRDPGAMSCPVCAFFGRRASIGGDARVAIGDMYLKALDDISVTGWDGHEVSFTRKKLRAVSSERMTLAKFIDAFAGHLVELGAHVIQQGLGCAAQGPKVGEVYTITQDLSWPGMKIPRDDYIVREIDGQMATLDSVSVTGKKDRELRFNYFDGVRAVWNEALAGLRGAPPARRPAPPAPSKAPAAPPTPPTPSANEDREAALDAIAEAMASAATVEGYPTEALKGLTPEERNDVHKRYLQKRWQMGRGAARVDPVPEEPGIGWAEELELYCDNTYEVYQGTERVIARMKRQRARGVTPDWTYFLPVANDGAHRYAKEFGYSPSQRAAVFTPDVLAEVAKALFEHHSTELDLADADAGAAAPADAGASAGSTDDDAVAPPPPLNSREEIEEMHRDLDRPYTPRKLWSTLAARGHYRGVIPIVLTASDDLDQESFDEDVKGIAQELFDRYLEEEGEAPDDASDGDLYDWISEAVDGHQCIIYPRYHEAVLRLVPRGCSDPDISGLVDASSAANDPDAFCASVAQLRAYEALRCAVHEALDEIISEYEPPEEEEEEDEEEDAAAAASTPPTAPVSAVSPARLKALQDAYDAGQRAPQFTPGSSKYPGDSEAAEAFGAGNYDRHGGGFTDPPNVTRRIVDVVDGHPKFARFARGRASTTRTGALWARLGRHAATHGARNVFVAGAEPAATLGTEVELMTDFEGFESGALFEVKHWNIAEDRVHLQPIAGGGPLSVTERELDAMFEPINRPRTRVERPPHRPAPPRTPSGAPDPSELTTDVHLRRKPKPRKAERLSAR